MSVIPQPADEFDAVRIVVEVLKNLKSDEQARVIRWAQEKLGVVAPPLPTSSGGAEALHRQGASDIATFIQGKKPANDVQFAAVVAYYYAFEASEASRKLEVSADDLKEATRLANTERLVKPIMTLHNAVNRGYLDKGSERGRFKINTVGENLVAMSLPTSNSTASLRKSKPASKKK
jgi:hypothetical protein